MSAKIFKAVVAAATALVLTATLDSAAAAELGVGTAVKTAAPVTLTVNAPSELVKGTRLYITAKAPSTSASGTARLEWSTDGSTWNSTKITVPIVDGQGAVSWSPVLTKQYRLVGGGFESAVWETSVVKKSGHAISAGTRTPQVHSLEAAYLVGKAVRDGVGAAFRIKIEQRTSSGSWSTLDTVTAERDGDFKVRVRPSSDMHFRARIINSSGTVLATSREFFVDRTSGTSTLEERRATLGWRLGAATTSARSIGKSAVSDAAYTGGATSARYQRFKNGLLVEVTSPNGSKQAWMLEGRHLKGYLDRGQWNGSLGLPERDTKCRLLEDGCVTLFSGGALYTNGSKMSRGIYAAYGRTSQVEIIAAALSQRGYEERSWRNSKYNDWIDGDFAWCQVFVAWATHASGHHGEAPVRTYFPSYLSAVKASPALIRNPRGSQIRPGDVLIFDWGTGDPTHTGLAVRVSGSYVYTIEGNTTDGTSDPQRGVYYRKRLISGVWGSFHPADYKANA